MAAVSNLTRRSFLKSAGAVVTLAATTPLWFDLTGKLFPSNGTGAFAATIPGEKWVPTTCWIGKQDCGMLARVVDGRVVKFEGHPDHPRNRGPLSVKGQAQILSLYDPYRVKAPLLRTNDKGIPGRWKEISWDEALTLAGGGTATTAGGKRFCGTAGHLGFRGARPGRWHALVTPPSGWGAAPHADE